MAPVYDPSEGSAPLLEKRSKAQRNRARVRSRWFFRGVDCLRGPPGIASCNDIQSTHETSTVFPGSETAALLIDSKPDEQSDTDDLDDILTFVEEIVKQHARHYIFPHFATYVGKGVDKAEEVSTLPLEFPIEKFNLSLPSDTDTSGCDVQQVQELFQGTASSAFDFEGIVSPESGAAYINTGPGDNCNTLALFQLPDIAALSQACKAHFLCTAIHNYFRSWARAAHCEDIWVEGFDDLVFRITHYNCVL